MNVTPLTAVVNIGPAYVGDVLAMTKIIVILIIIEIITIILLIEQ